MTQASTMTQAEYAGLSCSFRGGFVLYDLKPTLVLLGLIFCRETLDAGRLEAKVEFVMWAHELGKPGEVRKLRKFFTREVVAAGIVSYDSGRGVYRVEPDPEKWSKKLAPRAPEKARPGGQQEFTNLRAGAELPLPQRQTLSLASGAIPEPEARASGESPVEVAPTRPASSQSVQAPGATNQRTPFDATLFARLRQSLTAGTVEQDFPECFGPAATQPPSLASGVPEPAESTAGEGGWKNPPGGVGGKFHPPSTGGRVENSTHPGAEVQAPNLQGVAEPGWGGWKNPPSGPSRLDRSRLGFKDPRLDLKGWVEKSTRAWRWLESVDSTDDLKAFPQPWVQTCTDHPGYVLGPLKKKFEYRTSRKKVSELGELEKPLAFLAMVARKDQRMVR